MKYYFIQIKKFYFICSILKLLEHFIEKIFKDKIKCSQNYKIKECLHV